MFRYQRVKDLVVATYTTALNCSHPATENPRENVIALIPN